MRCMLWGGVVCWWVMVVCVYVCGAVLGVACPGVQEWQGQWGVGSGYRCQDDV